MSFAFGGPSRAVLLVVLVALLEFQLPKAAAALWSPLKSTDKTFLEIIECNQDVEIVKSFLVPLVGRLIGTTDPRIKLKLEMTFMNGWKLLPMKDRQLQDFPNILLSAKF
jgi:hypothetical protein